MEYDISVLDNRHVSRVTVEHIERAVDYVEAIFGDLVDIAEVIEDLTHLGEYIAFIEGTWLRVTRWDAIN